MKERRIVVSMDGGRVRLREPRKGRTRKGRKKFAANWRGSTCEQDAVVVPPDELASLPLTRAMPGEHKLLWTAK